MDKRQKRSAELVRELLDEGWSEEDVAEIGLDIYEYCGNSIIIIEDEEACPKDGDTVH